MKLILFLISLNLFAQWNWRNVTAPLIGPPTCCGGTKGSVNNTDPGKPGTGFGSGGGSSGWAGGSGGDAFWIGGGGGGGVGCYGAGGLVGGNGGRGAVVIQYYSGSSIVGSEIYIINTTVYIPTGVDSIKFWAVGGGGSGGTCSTSDGTNSSGGGAGAVNYRTITGITPGKFLNIYIGAGGIAPLSTGNGQNGNTTTVVWSPGAGQQQTDAQGGVGGMYNTGGTSAGGSCSSTVWDGCVQGGAAYHPAPGDYQGSSGGGIGLNQGTPPGQDSNDDDGQNGASGGDVSGLFSAISLSRAIIQNPNDGLASIASTPKAAFSFRKIINSYNGNCLRVRRASDNAETDISFAGDNCDMAALKAFVGNSSAYLTTWYNQTGGANAIQATAAAQPRISLNGTIDLSSNSKVPMIYFDGNTWLDTQQGAQTITNAGNEGTVLIVARPFSSSPFSFGVCNDPANDRWMAHYVWNNQSIYFDVGNLNSQRCVTGTTTPYDTWRVWSFIKTTSLSYVYWSKVLGCTSQNVSGQRFTGTQTFYIGWANGPGAGARFTGFISEFVVYSSAITGAELTNYQTKTMEYYGLQ